MAVSSCTLFMDDEELPPDQVGFDEVATIETDAVKIEYQFQENVKNIAVNVLEYVDHVEADSIVYFVAGTPKDYIPKVGECMAAIISHKIPHGLNHRVLSVSKQDGMTKVVGTMAQLEEVYKKFDADIDFSKVYFPDVTCVDSTTFEEYDLGSRDNIDWYNYDMMAKKDIDQYGPLLKEPDKEFVTRADDEDWEEKYGVDLINHKGTPHDFTITLMDIDTRQKNMDPRMLILRGLVINYLVEPMQKHFHAPIYARIKLEMPMSFTGFAHVGLNPLAKVHLQTKVEPELVLTLELGVGKSTDVDMSGVTEMTQDAILELSSRFLNKFDEVAKNNKSIKKLFGTKVTPPVPPIPLLPTPISLYVAPTFGLNFSWNIAGTFESHIYFKPLEVSGGGWHVPLMPYWVVDTDNTWGRTYPQNKSDYYKFAFTGGVSVSVSGGVEIGLEVPPVKAYTDIMIEYARGLDKSFFESFEVTPKNKDEYSIYTPSKNKITNQFDVVAHIGAGDIAGKWDALSAELFRGNIADFSMGLYPSLSDFGFSETNYDETTNYLTDFKVQMEFDWNGFFDAYKKDVYLAALVQSKDKDISFSQLYQLPTFVANLKENVTYEIDCSAIPECEEGFDVMPVLVHKGIISDDYTFDILGGNTLFIPGNAEAFVTKNIKNELIYNEKIINLTEKNMTLNHLKSVKQRYSRWDKYNANYYYVGWITSFDVYGGPNIEEYGVDVTIGYNDMEKGVSRVVLTREVPIQKNSTAPIKSGTKTLYFDFVSDMIQKLAWQSDMPSYMIDVRPYYRRKNGKKQHTVHSDRNIINVKGIKTDVKRYSEFDGKGSTVSITGGFF